MYPLFAILIKKKIISIYLQFQSFFSNNFIPWDFESIRLELSFQSELVEVTIFIIEFKLLKLKTTQLLSLALQSY